MHIAHQTASVNQHCLFAYCLHAIPIGLKFSLFADSFSTQQQLCDMIYNADCASMNSHCGISIFAIIIKIYMYILYIFIYYMYMQLYLSVTYKRPSNTSDFGSGHLANTTYIFQYIHIYQSNWHFVISIRPILNSKSWQTARAFDSSD